MHSILPWVPVVKKSYSARSWIKFHVGTIPYPTPDSLPNPN
jgi:hypothetical protein